MLKNISLTAIALIISAMAFGQVATRKESQPEKDQRKIKEEPALQAAPQQAASQKIPGKKPSSAKGTVIYFEDFSAGVMPSDYILYDEDGLTPANSVGFVNDAWIVYENLQDSTEFTALSTSWYEPPGQADDWMVLPKMNIPQGAVINWKAITYDNSYADGYQIRVSTTDSAVSSFTHVLVNIAEENNTWTNRTASLNNFAGQDVYIAFRNNSYDKFLLAINEIEIYQPPAFDIGVTQISNPTNDTGCTFTANEDVIVNIHNFGSDTISNGFDVVYQINGGTPVSETVNDTLAPGQGLNYTFTTQADLSAYQEYKIMAYTEYPQDNHPHNDTASTSVISGDGEITIMITTDTYPSETSWELLNQAGDIVAESKPYTVADSTYITTVCGLTSECYTFHIYDSYGDGIFSPGGYEVHFNNVLVDSSYSFDGSHETVNFIGNGCHADDLAVKKVFALGKLPKNGGSPQSVTALIRNVGTADQTNKKVSLEITGANPHQDTIIIPSIQSLEWDTVTFHGINASALGTQSVSVSVESDENAANNTAWYHQEVTEHTFNHADTSAIDMGIGFNTGDGMMVARYDVHGSRAISAARINVAGSAVGQNLYGVMLNANGEILSTGPEVTIAAADTNTYVELPIMPFNVTDQEVYVGFAQTASASDGYFPLNRQVEEPGRDNAFFFVSGLTGGPLTLSTDMGRWMMEAVVSEPIDKDAVITGISEVATLCNMTTAQIEIGIYNNGLDTIAGMDAGYTVNNNTPVVESISYTIMPGDTLMYTFNTEVDASSYDYYEIKAFVELAGDSIQENDTAMTSFYNVEPADIPYSTIFGPGDDNYAWTFIDNNQDGVAPVIEPVGAQFAQSGSNVVFVAGGADKQDEYVVSRCLNLETGVTYQLGYYHRAGSFWGMVIPENMQVVMGTSPEPQALTTVIANPGTVDTDVFTYMAHDFEVDTDGVYYLAFHITTDSPYFYLIDNVSVSDVTSVEKQQKDQILQVYPNPAKETLNIAASKQIYQIQVYNMVGQKVHEEKVNDSQTQLNVNHYQPGMYLIHITSEKGTTTKKFQVK